MGVFELRPGMLLGAASAATQVDGGGFGHTWNDWYERGYIKDGSNPGIATGHWEHWRQDVMLMSKMGLMTYRFGVEWARIEPEEGCFNDDAIDHVREEILLLRGLGIKPLLTLHHFTNPMWFENKGGWEKPGNIWFFMRFAEKIVRSLGHLVSEYITINEPNVYAYNGYMNGSWPPGKKSVSAVMQVMSVMASAHIRTYRLIHDVRRSMGFDDTRVSVALHMRVFEPKNPKNPAQAAAASLAEHLFQGNLARALTTGEFTYPLKNHIRAYMGNYTDFHAINYYTRSTVTGLADGVRDGCFKNDLGWEIYPDGIVACAEKMQKIRRLPIYITENGTCDNADSFRCRYIYDHLAAMSNSDLPFERYYHWCFNDNFEWLEGESARFGIVHTDYETLDRTIKRSGEFYSAIIRSGGVTEELYRRYVEPQEYHR